MFGLKHKICSQFFFFFENKVKFHISYINVFDEGMRQQTFFRCVYFSRKRYMEDPFQTCKIFFTKSFDQILIILKKIKNKLVLKISYQLKKTLKQRIKN